MIFHFLSITLLLFVAAIFLARLVLIRIRQKCNITKSKQPDQTAEGKSVDEVPNTSACATIKSQ